MPDWFIPNLANWASLWNLKKRWNFETDFTALLRVCKNVFVIGNVKHIFLLGFASLIDFVKNESQRKVSAANGKVLASHTAVCHRWRYSTCRRGWIAGPEGALRPRHQGCEKDLPRFVAQTGGALCVTMCHKTDTFCIFHSDQPKPKRVPAVNHDWSH